MSYSVSEVAKLAGVSVRTLHHYDAIGLLRPSARSEGGYRQYDHADLERLQQALFFRELGFPLEEIARILNDPAYDRKAALKMQRQLLAEKAARVQAMLAAVDRALESHEGGIAMTKEEMFEVFGDFDPSQYEAEAKQRWGDTDAYKESAKRTARYGKKEWKAIQEQGAELFERMAKLMDAGVASDSAQARAVAEEHRRYISRWFYPCAHEMHAGLGALYVADSRFTANIDRTRAGLSRYLREAFRANADCPAK